MTPPAGPTFRRLDPFNGWQLLPAPGVVGGDDDPLGLRLAAAAGSIPQVTEATLTPHLPPSWLAAGDRRGDVFVLARPGTGPWELLRRRPCDPSPRAMTAELDRADETPPPTAIAYHAGRLAAAGGGAVTVWDAATGRRIAAVRGLPTAAGLVPGFAPWGELVVLVDRPGRRAVLRRYSQAGDFRGAVRIPSAAQEWRLGRGADGAVWVAGVIDPQGRFDMWTVRPRWRQRPGACCVTLGWRVQRVTVGDPAGVTDRLRRALPPVGVAAAGPGGFCLTEPCPGGPADACFRRAGGSQVPRAEVIPAPPPAAPVVGRVVLGPIDSGLPRCRWHRVRTDADTPAGTAVRVWVATVETLPNEREGETIPAPGAGPATDKDVFHPSDWREVPGADGLIDQPPGRYLYAAVELRGTTDTGPALTGLRLDFPRATSLDRLPAVYRDDPDAADFTERFLALFDAGLEDLDAAIERFPAFLDPDRAPPAVLARLAGWLGMTFAPGAGEDEQRAQLRAAAGLFARRGTPAALRDAVGLAFGLNPNQVAVREGVNERAWGAVGVSARVGAVRLFPRAGGRFIAGRAVLGRTPLRGAGSAASDADRHGAFAVTVSVPANAAVRAAGAAGVRAVVEAFVPAHLTVRVRIGGRGLVVGRRAAVGVDTVLTPLPPAVVGRVGLGGGSVIRAARPTSRSFGVGAGRVGHHTVLG